MFSSVVVYIYLTNFLNKFFIHDIEILLFLYVVIDGLLSSSMAYLLTWTQNSLCADDSMGHFCLNLIGYMSEMKGTALAPSYIRLHRG